LLVAVVIGAAVMLTTRYDVRNRLLDIFLTLDPNLFAQISFERFLVIVTVVCVLVIGLVVVGSFFALTWMQGLVQQARAKEAAQSTAVAHAIDHLKAQVEQQYDRLMHLSSSLTQRLDKRALLQNIVHATAEITSLPHEDSIVGLWTMRFETEHLCFEMGARCDERFFSKTEFELTEPPFTRLLASKQVQRYERWQDGFPFIAPQKVSQLGSTTSLILIPLIIERTIPGCLVVFCHPDFLKQYDQQPTFYQAAWGQLGLALSIAIQGELAILDRLTGVANQTYFLKRLAQEIDRSNRYQIPLGVLMIDIDHFKAVNDTLGHPQGDAVLRIVSRLIRKEVRAIDLVARYGGEEFIVMMPETGFTEELGTSPGAMIVAERIRSAVESEFKAMQKPLAITISIGVAVRRQPQDRNMDVKEVVRLADAQLYKAKTSGRNRCCVYMPEDAELPQPPSSG
jgi:diguanylate cyclase (GGDEF)-like protein